MARSIVDLSQEIFQGMPVYPGHLKTVVWKHMSHEECRQVIGVGEFSYESFGILMSDHGPTHVDAIRHLDTRPDAPAVDQMSLDYFFGPAICLDLSHVPEQTHITKSDIVAALEKANLSVTKIVLIYTDHYRRRYGSPEWLSHYPGLDREATEYLSDCGCINIGIDAPSVDTPVDKTYPCHMVCRERWITNTENLCNLQEVAGKGFEFIGLPLRIRGGSGSPIRAVALLDE